MTQENMTFNHALYHRVSSLLDASQCLLIHDFFYNALDSDSNDLVKTHFFHGRYENVYLKNNTFKPLNQLLSDAKDHAAGLLNCQPSELSMDYWFNDMPPKHITDWHRHDVMDEQLSGVYYVTVPENSGDLLLKSKATTQRIKPRQNYFVFFAPNINHSVEENKSPQSRLSIGMNFGFIADKEDK